MSDFEKLYESTRSMDEEYRNEDDEDLETARKAVALRKESEKAAGWEDEDDDPLPKKEEDGEPKSGWMNKLEDDQGAADNKARGEKDQLHTDQAEDNARNVDNNINQAKEGKDEIVAAVADNDLSRFAKAVRGSGLNTENIVNSIMKSDLDTRLVVDMLVRAAAKGKG